MHETNKYVRRPRKRLEEAAHAAGGEGHAATQGGRGKGLAEGEAEAEAKADAHPKFRGTVAAGAVVVVAVAGAGRLANGGGGPTGGRAFVGRGNIEESPESAGTFAC